MNFQKDTGYLYINKNGCLEFISVHGEVSVMSDTEVVSKSNFFSILMDESKINGKNTECTYIPLIKRTIH